MRKRKDWSELSTKEANRIRERHCSGCKYLIDDNTIYANCCYILVTKRSRGCDVRDCKLKEKK